MNGIEKLWKKKSKQWGNWEYIVVATTGTDNHSFRADTVEELVEDIKGRKEICNFLNLDKYNSLTEKEKNDLDAYDLFEEYTYFEDFVDCD